jgi:hypothetical protein
VSEEETMTTQKTDRAICDAATPGEWQVDEDPCIVGIHTDDFDVAETSSTNRGADATFIAHFDPVRVRAMLDEIRDLRIACKAAGTTCNEYETDLAEARATARALHYWVDPNESDYKEAADTIAGWGDDDE